MKKYAFSFVLILVLFALSSPLLAQEAEMERSQFRSLLLQNPNYFGNLPKSPLKSVKVMKGNIKYEEVTCVGYNPELSLLQAVVQIKLPYGYKGSLCQSGSTEYVRFFVNYNGGWENVGLAAFNVHDIPGLKDCAGQPQKPLSYTVTCQLEIQRKPCFAPFLPRVRAVLSWEDIPPDDNADWSMVWGNSLDAYIQIKPRPWIIHDIFTFLEIQTKKPVPIPKYIEMGLPQPVPLPEPPEMRTIDQLVELYKPQKDLEESMAAVDKARAQVFQEPHRFGYPDIAPLLNPLPLSSQTVVEKMAIWKKLDLDLGKTIDILLSQDGNTRYEELLCLGLDYNREWLAATIHIKRPCGYLGDLCQKGSREFVAFWADWDDQCEWQYLDTVSVTVHDIHTIPAAGLDYTVFLPVNLDQIRRSCAKPKIARLRAVLSWHQPPSTTDPDQLPRWGNRRDTHVQIKPGAPVLVPLARISILGGVGIDDINTTGNGLTKPDARFAFSGSQTDKESRECPFGGTIYVHAPPILHHKYCVSVRKQGTTGSGTILAERVYVVNQDGIGSFHYPDVNGCFTYLDIHANVTNVLAAWPTTGDDLWEISLKLLNLGNVVISQTPWYKIQLDNTPPAADISIDGGACDQYTPGATLSGQFVAKDKYFGKFTLETLPASMNLPDPVTVTPYTSPTSMFYPGNWTLGTGGWQPCGYVVRIRVWDRSIINSGYGQPNHNSDDAGFCLLNKK